MHNTTQAPRKCPVCRKGSVHLATIRHSVDVKYEGKAYSVEIPDLPVNRCDACGEALFDLESDARIDTEFRRVAGLLTAADIRRARKQLRLKQAELAEALGMARATVSRWETRTLVQSRASDKILRAYFHDAHIRDVMRRIDSDPSIGTFVEGRESLDDPPPDRLPLVDASEPVMPADEPLPVNRIAKKFSRLIEDTSGDAGRYIKYARDVQVQGCLLDIK